MCAELGKKTNELERYFECQFIFHTQLEWLDTVVYTYNRKVHTHSHTHPPSSLLQYTFLGHTDTHTPEVWKLSTKWNYLYLWKRININNKTESRNRRTTAVRNWQSRDTVTNWSRQTVTNLVMRHCLDPCRHETLWLSLVACYHTASSRPCCNVAVCFIPHTDHSTLLSHHINRVTNVSDPPQWHTRLAYHTNDTRNKSRGIWIAWSISSLKHYFLLAARENENKSDFFQCTAFCLDDSSVGTHAFHCTADQRSHTVKYEDKELEWWITGVIYSRGPFPARCLNNTCRTIVKYRGEGVWVREGSFCSHGTACGSM